MARQESGRSMDVPTKTRLSYDVDAYLRSFTALVVAADPDANAIALDCTAFYPGGGGQPHDEGQLAWGGKRHDVVRVRKHDGAIWHELAADGPLPAVGSQVHGELDWRRRHLLMRTHTAMHVVNGVLWLDHRVQVTGVNMTPGEGRIDVELPSMPAGFGRDLEKRVNEQLDLDLPIRVEFVARSEADTDESLIRSKADLIPRSVDPLRVINIVGLDRQADGGTHVASTAEVGHIRVLKTESKGRLNKRIRLAVVDA
jgi:misacylated tRNA(Ala) deacylase